MKRRPPHRFAPRPSHHAAPRSAGVLYEPDFVTPAERAEVLNWLSTLHPLWEQRYSPSNPPPQGQSNRGLLRPVYWLGNWQFACLDYYHPPKGLLNRCVRAEPFPKVLADWVARIDRKVRAHYSPLDIPRRWQLNTCLVNFYGSRLHPTTGKHDDVARVGEHKDFEPGPVASVSLGDRALFQFVRSAKIGERDGVVLQQWLDDCSLQIFAGENWKRKLFHRVQRVEKKRGEIFPPAVPHFETRRINFTFRFVPEEHWVSYADLPEDKASDIKGYLQELAEHSRFFADALSKRKN